MSNIKKNFAIIFLFLTGFTPLANAIESQQVISETIIKNCVSSEKIRASIS